MFENIVFFPGMSFLNQDAIFVADQFTMATTGVQDMGPTWKRCVRDVGFYSYKGSGLILVAGSMYVRRHFDSGTHLGLGSVWCDQFPRA